MQLAGDLDDGSLHLVDTGIHEIADNRSFFFPRHPFWRHPHCPHFTCYHAGQDIPDGRIHGFSRIIKGPLEIIGFL